MLHAWTARSAIAISNVNDSTGLSPGNSQPCHIMYQSISRVYLRQHSKRNMHIIFRPCVNIDALQLSTVRLLCM